MGAHFVMTESLRFGKEKQFQMTKSVKIVVALAISIIALIISGMAVGIYYFLEFRKGGQLFEEGYAAEGREDYDVAIEKLSEALRHKLTKSDLSGAYASRGAAYRSRGKSSDAIRDYSEAIRLYPDWAYAYFGRAWTYQCNGEPGKAIPDYAEAIRYDPNRGRAYYNRGLIYLRRQQWDSAITDFNEAIRCFPRESDPLLARGLSYLGKGDLDGALANFDGAITIDSSNPEGYLFRSNVYFMKREDDKQLRDYNEALRLASVVPNNRPQAAPPPANNYRSLFEKVRRADDEGNFDRAIELSNEFLDMEMPWKQASPALMNRGNAFKAKGDLDRAFTNYEQAVAFDPANAGAHVDRALVLEKKGQRDQAQRDYAEAIRLDPKMWEAYFNRAAAFREGGQFDKAIADLTKVTELKPNFAGAYINRAAIYLRKSDIDKAMDNCNKAIEVDPNSALAYTNRASAHVRKKQYLAAERDLGKAMQLGSAGGDSALNSVAWFRATCPDSRLRDGPKAVADATKACELTQWKQWGPIDTLAAAYAESGNFEQAVKHQTHALELAHGPNKLVERARERLALYQQHKPYREEPQY